MRSEETGETSMNLPLFQNSLMFYIIKNKSK